MNLTLALSVLFVLVEWDRYSFAQIGLSQPLIAATLAGALAGDWQIGLLVGAMLQMLWVTFIPVGASIYTNESVSSAALGAFAAIQHETRPEILMVLLLLLLPMTVIALLADTLGRSVNAVLANMAKICIRQGNYQLACRWHLGGLVVNAVNGLSVGWLCMIALGFCWRPLEMLVESLQLSASMSVLWKMLPVAGVLFLAHESFQSWRTYLYFVGGCALGGLLIYGGLA